ncbi:MULTISPECIES: D-alanyl-D-alanine carboxypeptidase [unclassified Paracoccus (in: a-proteobacteria)]|uniref:D-alanyl-D-alanine carboxypeptidase n=1 Tax=unclassified Paracoccus (in: a-proteobacteria) TaxID=2688777 RepID=UPI0012B3D9C7|nr:MULTISPECIES: D-alanyl-D-alanine carboxypeptidase [unclassified Paracoccus (in: a-proteobacteria)]UXU74491.1 D-alanyl-D-alanine carboxypeptidase [Paracoccus sp. SMMA_5]UXU80384.1 D-alanyl-D-alanine carboxypeptidase [Paracoccus sp. SMMA_5_TC]
MSVAALDRRGFLAGLLAAGLAPSWARAADLPPPRVAQARLSGTVAYALMDAVSGAMIEGYQPDLSLPAASTLKTVTTLYALDRLGPEHRFSTRVIRAGNMLVLAGGGDPVLDTDALDQLAAATVEAERTAGRAAPTTFAVWGGALPRVAQLDPAQAVHLPYNPSISGMILNFNRVHLQWRRGAQGPQLSLEARGRRLSPRAYTASIAPVARRAPLFDYDGSGQKENWTIARSALDQPGSRWLPVRRPELYAGDVFQTLCRARGLVLPAPETIEILPDGPEIARQDSPPLRDLARDMLAYSTNLTAEVLGLSASGAGDVAQSAAAMAQWLRGQGIEGAFSFQDHSGLAAGNRLTARILAQVLAGPGQRQNLRALLKPIPIKAAPGADAEPDLHVAAKTGTLNFVSNLAGYARRAEGPDRIFAILTADEPRRAATEGQELPDGVLAWTRQSKALQQGLIADWCPADQG